MGAAITFVRRDVLAELSPKPSSRGPKRVATDPVRGGWSGDAARGRGRGPAGSATGVVLAAVLLVAGACSGGSGSSASSGSSGSSGSSRVSISAEPSDSSGPPNDPAGSGGATPSLSVSVPASLTPAEAEAAASAVEAYRQYVEVFNQVRQGGGTHAQLLKSVAVQSALQNAQYEVANLTKRRLHQVGNVIIVRLGVRSATLQADTGDYQVPQVVLGGCEDTSAADLLDSMGKSVRAADVPRHWSTVVWVRYYPKVNAGSNGWVVSRLENEGASGC